MRACVTSPEVIQETALCVRVKIRLACVLVFLVRYKCSLSIPTVPPYRHECDRDHAQPARWVEIRPQRLDHTSPGASGSRRSRSAGRRAGGGVSAESAVRDCVI